MKGLAVKCAVCGKEFETERQLHGHLKAHKLRMAEYYQKYFPRKDKYSGELIKFKSKEYYFDRDFNSRDNLRLWLKNQDENVAAEYCKKILENRKDKKDILNSPTQIELRSLMMPSIQVYNKYFDNYYELCEEIGLIPRYEDVNSYSFPWKASYLSEENSKDTLKNLEVYVDTREQKPLKFDAKVSIKNLKFGDYAFSYNGETGSCRVERKSLPDFLSTMSGGYSRFVNEIERAGESGVGLLVLVEEKFNNALSFKYLPHISKRIKATPEYIFHNVRELTQSYPNVQFLFVDGRKECSRVTQKIFLNEKLFNDLDLQLAYDLNYL